MKSIMTLLAIILSVTYSFAQTLELIDEVESTYGISIKDLKINNIGERFYLLGVSLDSLKINNNLIGIGSPDFGKDSFVGVRTSGVPKFGKYPGGRKSLLTDTSILLFTPILEDTLFTTDTFYVNTTNGNGANLLLREYNFAGDLINFKQWPTSVGISDVMLKNGKIYVSGSFIGSRLLDGILIEEVEGNGDGFAGVINSDFEFEWLTGFSGWYDESFTRISMNKNGKILATGSSTSSAVTACDDYIVNQAVVGWGTNFLYMVQLDTLGNCIQTKTVDYDYGSIFVTGETTLADGSYVLVGGYTSKYIGFDSMYLYHPFDGQGILPLGFIAKLDKNLQAQAVYQGDGSKNFRTFYDVISYDKKNTWICGWATDDTLKMGDFELYSSFGEGISFIAKLDKNLNPFFAYEFDQQSPIKFIIGQDGNLYVLTKDGHKKYFLYKITDTTTNPGNETALDVKLFPNPINSGTVLEYEVIPDENSGTLKTIKIYAVDGKLVASFKRNGNTEPIILPYLSAGVYFVVFVFEGGRVTKKVVVI